MLLQLVTTQQCNCVAEDNQETGAANTVQIAPEPKSCSNNCVLTSQSTTKENAVCVPWFCGNLCSLGRLLPWRQQVDFHAHSPLRTRRTWTRVLSAYVGSQPGSLPNQRTALVAIFLFKKLLDLMKIGKQHFPRVFEFLLSRSMLPIVSRLFRCPRSRCCSRQDTVATYNHNCTRGSPSCPNVMPLTCRSTEALVWERAQRWFRAADSCRLLLSVAGCCRLLLFSRADWGSSFLLPSRPCRALSPSPYFLCFFSVFVSFLVRLFLPPSFCLPFNFLSSLGKKCARECVEHSCNSSSGPAIPSVTRYDTRDLIVLHDSIVVKRSRVSNASFVLAFASSLHLTLYLLSSSYGHRHNAQESVRVLSQLLFVSVLYGTACSTHTI